MKRNRKARRRHRAGRRALTLALGLGGWGALLLGAAAPSGAPGIAVVDAAKVTEISASLQKELAAASRNAQKASDEAVRLRNELAKASKDDAAQKDAVTEEENERRVKAMRRLNDSLEEAQAKAKLEMAKAEREAIGPLRDRVIEAVRAVAGRKGIGVVLARENAVHYDPALEITREVAAEVDKATAASGKKERSGRSD